MCVLVGERGRRRQSTETQCERQRLWLLGLWEEWVSFSTTTHSWQLPRQVRDICQHTHTHITQICGHTHTKGIWDQSWEIQYKCWHKTYICFWINIPCVNLVATVWNCNMFSDLFFEQSGLFWLPLTAQSLSWCGESRQQWRLVLINVSQIGNVKIFELWWWHPDLTPS